MILILNKHINKKCIILLSYKFNNVVAKQVSYELLLSVLEYQTAVMRSDFDNADLVLPRIPREQRTRVAHFLQKQVIFFYFKSLFLNIIL